MRWVNNQQARWASCSPASREIRVSTRLRQCPEWVIDAVLVHELAHLQEADHSPAFYDLAESAPAPRRVRGVPRGLRAGTGSAHREGDVDA